MNSKEKIHVDLHLITKNLLHRKEIKFTKLPCMLKMFNQIF